MFKFCVKFEQIEQSAAELLTIKHIIAVKFLRGSHLHVRISGVRGPNFTKLAEDIRQSSLLTEFVSELRYLAALSNAGRSKRATLNMTPNFA